MKTILIIFLLTLSTVERTQLVNQNISLQDSLFTAHSLVQAEHENLPVRVASLSDTLFKIFTGNKIGYMNSAGEIVISPVYLSAGDFSEGLAEARINGQYGYIDATGTFVIAPQFDYATPFHDGIAIVFNDTKPFFIDTKGNLPFISSYASVSGFEKGRAFVKTSTGKTGIINTMGVLVIDTIFNSIGNFNEGLSVVSGLNNDPPSATKKVFQIGVIDTTGKFIVHYGKYSEINDFVNGYSRVEIPPVPGDEDGYTSRSGFIDKKGKLLFSRDHKDKSSIDGDISCGLAKIYLNKYQTPDERGIISTSDRYQGYINLKGEIVLNDPTYKYVHDFSEGRAFAEDDDWHYYLLNLKGERITSKVFDRVLETGFQNNLAFVEQDNKWGAIDTNGNFVIAPQFNQIDQVGLAGDYFFFTEPDPDNQDREVYGMANRKGEIIIKPVMEDFDRSGFENGLLKTIVKNKFTYYDKNGKVIWQESETKNTPEDVNIDFMGRGYYYAFEEPAKEEIQPAAGNDGRNFPKKISLQKYFPPGKLSVIASASEYSLFEHSYNGFKVYVVNNTGKAITFNTQDNRLYMKIQALNKNGEWKDIEYLPGSWCGNSYYDIQLKSRYYWMFTSPVYHGDFKTRMRIELTYANSSNNKTGKKEQVTIYSNEFDGNVNPGQFWRKNAYVPQGIMDPYND